MSEIFRRFTILEKYQESALITSFFLKPVDNKPLWKASAGQYLTIRVPTKSGTVLRCYSISGDVQDPHRYRISVKREAAPTDSIGVIDGIGSSWLHDQITVGEQVEVATPRGQFVLDEDSVRPVVLLSAGVGLTPLVSMLHSLKARKNDVWFIHACENSEAHAFREEVETIATGSGGRIRTHFIYRKPTQRDTQIANFDSQDAIDRDLIQRLLPLDDYDLYLCGPKLFMSSMFQLFQSMGLPSTRIAYEFFGKGQALDTLNSNCQQSFAAIENESQGFEIFFTESERKTHWNNHASSLLELAEEIGLSPEYSCREGLCGTCVCELKEGSVEYSEEPLDPVPKGHILLCCSRPIGRVVLAL